MTPVRSLENRPLAPSLCDLLLLQSIVESRLFPRFANLVTFIYKNICAPPKTNESYPTIQYFVNNFFRRGGLK
ncbi:MAG: hypothetical protein DMG85_12295 [Acidobacteria bacterium]|nr:MAG: hypothetical protein DMG85_12295 [Acidobacteriota bacterium]